MKRSVALFICVAIAALALGLCACSSSSGSPSASQGSSASSASSSSSAAAPASASAQSSSASASASSSSAKAASAAASSSAAAPSAASAQSSAGFDFVDECIDEHGNISLYALTELKGWQVATLLDQQGYQWSDSNAAWTRPEDGAAFAAVKETGPYTIDTYNEMNEKGGAIVAISTSVVAGYKDPQAALAGNAQCVVEDSYFDSDGSGIAIFYGPSMKEYLAIISPNSESTASFLIFSQEAVASGMADEALGVTTGGSFQAIWKSVTGEDSYGA